MGDSVFADYNNNGQIKQSVEEMLVEGGLCICCLFRMNVVDDLYKTLRSVQFELSSDTCTVV